MEEKHNKHHPKHAISELMKHFLKGYTKHDDTKTKMEEPDYH
jgi:hypothetical protein